MGMGSQKAEVDSEGLFRWHYVPAIAAWGGYSFDGIMFLPS